MGRTQQAFKNVSVAQEQDISGKKFLPSNRAVALAAIAYKKENGHYPTSRSGGAYLPENSVRWPSIIKNLVKHRTPLTQVVTNEVENSTEAKKAFQDMIDHLASQKITKPEKPCAMKPSKPEKQPKKKRTGFAANDAETLATLKMPRKMSLNLAFKTSAKAANDCEPPSSGFLFVSKGAGFYALKPVTVHRQEKSPEQSSPSPVF